MYCNIDDVRGRNRLILTSSVVSDSEVLEKIEEGQSVIDSALSGKVTLPLQGQIPKILRKINADLSASDLILSKVANDGTEQEAIQAQILNKNAMALIDKITNGTLKVIPDTSLPNTQGLPTIKSSTYGKRRRFENWRPHDPESYWFRVDPPCRWR